MAENNFEKLLGKNGELVGYREKQVLEGAFGIIRCHYEDKPNKIEAIAKLFGKELGEVFPAQCRGYMVSCKFEPEGLWLKPHGGFWALNNPWLLFLLTGEAKIVEDKE